MLLKLGLLATKIVSVSSGKRIRLLRDRQRRVGLNANEYTGGILLVTADKFRVIP
jgi:hypothetical protein